MTHNTWIITVLTESFTIFQKKKVSWPPRLTTLFADANVGILLIGFTLTLSSFLEEKQCFHAIYSFQFALLMSSYFRELIKVEVDDFHR